MGLFSRFFSSRVQSTAPRQDSESQALELIAKGNALEDEGTPRAALDFYDAALRLTPHLARGHLNRGNALFACGDMESALAAFCKALKIDPEYASAHFNLGNTWVRLGDVKSAQAAYQRAIALKPDFVDAEVALGALLDDLRDFEGACAHYRRALVLQPDYAQAHCNLGKSLRDLGRFDDAVVCFGKALELNPAYAEAYVNLGVVLGDLGEQRKALDCYRQALNLKPEYLAALSNLLFLLNYETVNEGISAFAEAQRFGEAAAQLATPFIHWNVAVVPSRCLRVGFVSGDFRTHPVSYFLEGVLVALSQTAVGRLEFVAYSNHSFEDSVTDRLKKIFHAWRSCAGLEDAEMARRIHDDAVDILIDLSGHTASNRLPVFAFKSAPVQVSWLGYFATTGLKEIDYLVADPWTLLPSEEQLFVEHIWRLPETRLCFTPPPFDIGVTSLPALDSGHITFASFNNSSKITDSVVALWAQVLREVPNSRLFLKSPQLEEVRIRLAMQARFLAQGVDPSQLIFEGLSPRDQYLAAYNRVDIALDPFPYTGGTTSAEALWMGVPVLTLAGRSFLSRQGVGLLANAGLMDWIAENPQDYVDRARSHAKDLSTLSRLRTTLRQRVLTTPLFDAKRFASHFEAALRNMWCIWCDQTTNQAT